MHKRITFKGMDHSPVIEQYANKQLSKIEHFLENEPTPIYIDLVLEPSKTREHHFIELRVKSPHYDLISNYEHNGTDFYDVLDRVIDVMYRKLHDEKKKHVDQRKSTGRHDDFKKQR